MSARVAPATILTAPGASSRPTTSWSASARTAARNSSDNANASLLCNFIIDCPDEFGMFLLRDDCRIDDATIERQSQYCDDWPFAQVSACRILAASREARCTTSFCSNTL